MKRLCLACVTVGIWVLALAVTSGAQKNVLQVPHEYPTIQAAVDAASPGDHIRVAAGVYMENVQITTSDLRLEASNRVVIDGTGLLGPGVRIAGTAAQPLSGVELAGFEIRDFEQGIVVEQAVAVMIHRNYIHHNEDKVAPFIPLTDGVGIDLRTVRFSKLSENFVHRNGGGGIHLRLGSTRNVVRGNRVDDNGGQFTNRDSSGILVTGNLSDNNDLLENEVIANNGWGIFITRPTGLPLTGTLVAQNRVHGNMRAGISVMGSVVSGNAVLQNNATGNSIGGITTSPCYPFDLFDDAPINNTWARNHGTAPAGLECATCVK